MSLPPLPRAGTYPCWRCEHYAGPGGPNMIAALCTHRATADTFRVHAMPEHGCVYWRATTRTPMRLLVCGGRDNQDRDHVFVSLDRLLARRAVTLVIHGACQDRAGNLKGADRWADEWAAERGIERLPCPADWDRHGPRAGPLRNAHMLTHRPDGVVAFPGGRGTDGMARLAIEAGVPVWWPRQGG